MDVPTDYGSGDAQQPHKRARIALDSRTGDIRKRSYDYGERFCLEHALDILHTVEHRDQRRDSTEDDTSKDDIKVRVYDRTANRMIHVSLDKVVESIPVDEETGAPMRLRATPFGQVVLNGDLHLSAIIHVAISMAWDLVLFKRTIDVVM